jgi:hypothetical protein
MRTLPPRHASFAAVLVRWTRTAHSHASTRTRSSSAIVRTLPKAARLRQDQLHDRRTSTTSVADRMGRWTITLSWRSLRPRCSLPEDT